MGENDLQKALELSEKEAEEAAKQSASVAKSKPNDMIDFFASPEEPQASASSSFQSNGFGAVTPFGGFGQPGSFGAQQADPFVALMQQQQMQQQQLQQQIAQQQMQQNLFAMQQQQPVTPNPFAANGFGGIPTSTSSNSINSAFAPANLGLDQVPRKVTPQATELNLLNDVARNRISTGFNPTQSAASSSNPFAAQQSTDVFSSLSQTNDIQSSNALVGAFGNTNSNAANAFGTAAQSKNPFQAASPKFGWENSSGQFPSQNSNQTLSQLAAAQSTQMAGNQFNSLASVPSVALTSQPQQLNGFGQSSVNMAPFGQAQSSPFGGVQQQNPGFQQMAPFGTAVPTQQPFF
ncbi:hypothetical protein HDU96_003956 [Phlyctochytrium bullatum]|nr:hypothetical protein HDU96_003956 [Phlyctochytrium bullatum]